MKKYEVIAYIPMRMATQEKALLLKQIAKNKHKIWLGGYSPNITK